MEPASNGWITGSQRQTAHPRPRRRVSIASCSCRNDSKKATENMKKQFLRSLSFSTIFLANLPAWAQTGGAALAPSDLLPTANLDTGPINKNRLGLSYRMGLNISVDFRKLGGLALSNPGPATGNTVNRNYDNG